MHTYQNKTSTLLNENISEINSIPENSTVVVQILDNLPVITISSKDYSYSIPFDEKSEYGVKEPLISTIRKSAELSRFFFSRKIIGYGLKEQIKKLGKLNIDIKKIHVCDIEVPLKWYYGYDINEATSHLLGKSGIQINSNTVFEYCERILELYEYLREHHKDDIPYELSSLVALYAKAELYGISIDREKFQSLYEKAISDMEKAELSIYSLAEMQALKNQKISFNSPKQINFILNNYFNINATKTDGESLLKIQADKNGKKFIEELIKYRKASKLYSTLSKFNGSFYYCPTWDFMKAITGRHNSGFHSLNTEIRQIFNSRFINGFLVIADANQIEIRIAASLSNERKLIDMLNADIDAHRLAASIIFRCEPSQVTDEQRKIGKKINFSMFYGGAESLYGKIESTEIKELKEKFLDNFKDLKNWIEEKQAFVKEYEYIETPFGRRIKIPYKDATDKEHALKCAVNYIIQSTASDLMMYYLLKIDKTMQDKDMKSIFVGSIHDSLIFDVVDDEIEEIMHIINNTIDETRFNWLNCKIPIKYDFMELK